MFNIVINSASVEDADMLNSTKILVSGTENSLLIKIVNFFYEKERKKEFLLAHSTHILTEHPQLEGRIRENNVSHLSKYQCNVIKSLRVYE